MPLTAAGLAGRAGLRYIWVRGAAMRAIIFLSVLSLLALPSAFGENVMAGDSRLSQDDIRGMAKAKPGSGGVPVIPREESRSRPKPPPDWDDEFVQNGGWLPDGAIDEALAEALEEATTESQRRLYKKRAEELKAWQNQQRTGKPERAI